MKSRFILPILAVAASVIIPSFAVAESQPAPMPAGQPAGQPAGMVQAFMPPTERLAEGTIKGLQFFIEMLDGREQFSKVYAGKKDIPTHHLAIIVADKKHQMATEAKVQLKITNTEGKSEKMDIAYNTGSKHIGHDFSFNKLGKYSFEGTLTFKGEKKPFKFQYTVK